MGWINHTQQQRDHAGLRDVCSACGHSTSLRNPLVLSDDGYRIHKSHTTDPSNGFYGRHQEG